MAAGRGIAMSARTTIVVDGVAHAVDLARKGDEITARVDETATTFALRRDGVSWRLTGNDGVRTATVVRDRDTVWIALDGEIHRCTVADDGRGGGAAGGVHSPKVIAPMPGKVLAVRVEVGQAVAAGDPLVVLEAMKMETIVSADAAAQVREVNVAANDMVEPGQVLIVLQFD